MVICHKIETLLEEIRPRAGRGQEHAALLSPTVCDERVGNGTRGTSNASEEPKILLLVGSAIKRAIRVRTQKYVHRSEQAAYASGARLSRISLSPFLPFSWPISNCLLCGSLAPVFGDAF